MVDVGFWLASSRSISSFVLGLKLDSSSLDDRCDCIDGLFVFSLNSYLQRY